MQNLKQQPKYKKGDEVKFHYYYEDKIGKITEVLADNKYFISSLGIEYPVTLEKILGKIIHEHDKQHSEGDTASIKET